MVYVYILDFTMNAGERCLHVRYTSFEWRIQSIPRDINEAMLGKYVGMFA